MGEWGDSQGCFQPIRKSSLLCLAVGLKTPPREK